MEFDAWIEFGKWDEVSNILEYELSEEDAKRISKSIEEGNEFIDDDAVEDIYNAVYDAFVTQVTEEMIENNLEEVKEYLDEGESLDNWRADDTYRMWISYREEYLL